MKGHFAAMAIAVILLTLLISYANASPLLIGAFNIQIFGVSKMDKPEVVATLVKIVDRYDILMIQEIRDASGDSLPELVDKVNEASAHTYSYVVSPRTGRTSSKEQYGYIFRSQVVRVSGEYQYPDHGDVFEREPYAVQFERITSGEQKQFSYISIHAKPDDAVAEIDALDDVYDQVVLVFGQDALIGGDFNADCSYVCSSCWDEIDLWLDQRFTWLISSSDDTTVSSNNCAYDRLVVAGSLMTSNSQNPGSVFRFDLAYGLSYEETKDVSDHYPVEFYLK